MLMAIMMYVGEYMYNGNGITMYVGECNHAFFNQFGFGYSRIEPN